MGVENQFIFSRNSTAISFWSFNHLFSVRHTYGILNYQSTAVYISHPTNCHSLLRGFRLESSKKNKTRSFRATWSEVNHFDLGTSEWNFLCKSLKNSSWDSIALIWIAENLESMSIGPARALSLFLPYKSLFAVKTEYSVLTTDLSEALATGRSFR